MRQESARRRRRLGTPATCKTAFARVNHERDIVGHMVGHICHRTDIVSEALSLHQLNIKEICKPSRCKVCWLDSKGLATPHAGLCWSHCPYCSCSTRVAARRRFYHVRVMLRDQDSGEMWWRHAKVIADCAAAPVSTEGIRMYRYRYRSR